MNFLQIVGSVLVGLLILYIACRLIFTAYFVTLRFYTSHKGQDNGKR